MNQAKKLSLIPFLSFLKILKLLTYVFTRFYDFQYSFSSFMFSPVINKEVFLESIHIVWNRISLFWFVRKIAWIPIIDFIFVTRNFEYNLDILGNFSSSRKYLFISFFIIDADMRCILTNYSSLKWNFLKVMF